VTESDLHEQIKITYAIYLRESEKFDEEGVKVSAVRARQALHDLKQLIIERRREIQEKKSDL
jgi:hypothetical protein